MSWYLNCWAPVSQLPAAQLELLPHEWLVKEGSPSFSATLSGSLASATWSWKETPLSFSSSTTKKETRKTFGIQTFFFPLELEIRGSGPVLIFLPYSLGRGWTFFFLSFNFFFFNVFGQAPRAWQTTVHVIARGRTQLSN